MLLSKNMTLFYCAKWGDFLEERLILSLNKREEEMDPKLMIQPHYPIIQIIAQAYEIKQLGGRKRRIAALLPYDYYHSDKQYPVLFLNDGQNLWEDDAPYGNWGIDDTLKNMAAQGMKDVIIIAIDHGGKERIAEYTPYSTPKFGEAQGDLYLDFLINTLKPYIEKTFRIAAGRENIGIGGSSMGGLISLYAGIKHSHVFSKLMVFSPSLWIAPKLFEDIQHCDPYDQVEMYMYAGKHESESHLDNVKRFEQVLQSSKCAQKTRFNLSINPNGTHSEVFWENEFPHALKWLYYNNHKEQES